MWIQDFIASQGNGERSLVIGAPPNKRLQRIGIRRVSLIVNLQHDAVVARPLKRGVRC